MPDLSIQELLSPELLLKISDYSLLSRLAVKGFLSGIHPSTCHGSGNEFVQYRNYTPGDDLKLLDWKLLARRNKLCTKIFAEETNMRCAIVLDASASMAYKGKNAIGTKFHYASAVAACLASLCHQQIDQAGLFIYADKILSATPPGHNAGNISHILATLQNVSPSNKANHLLALQKIGEYLKKRSLVVLLTDGYFQEKTLPYFLKQLKFSGHDCIVCQILDPDELHFPFQNTMQFIDSETSESRTATASLTRDEYLKKMNAFLEKTRQICLNYQADYLQINTSQSIAPVLTSYLNMRGGKH
ncbi:MAG: DUF58 domain-containing protein [Lentisphaeria bacterium]